MTTLPAPQIDLPETVWKEAQQLLEAPFVVAASLWRVAVEGLDPPHHPEAHGDDHKQLVVPEPFDVADALGLFA